MKTKMVKIDIETHIDIKELQSLLYRINEDEPDMGQAVKVAVKDKINECKKILGPKIVA